MKNVIVYSKPGCPPCNATKTTLDKKGVKYQEVDISVDQEGLEKVRSLGFLKAPVVVTDDDSWSGFRPQKIDALVASLKSMEVSA